jgi:hypothetical protein
MFVFLIEERKKKRVFSASITIKNCLQITSKIYFKKQIAGWLSFGLKKGE